jgi:lipoprotein-anchoring transpeptidase ErfK/SrfK
MRHALALLLAATLLTACSSDPADSEADPSTAAGGGASGSPSDDASPARAGSIRSNVERGASDVPVDTLLRVAATHGRLSTVTVSGSGEAGDLTGAIAGDGGVWTTEQRLEPGTTYAVEAVVRGDDGDLVTRRSRFSTQDLTLDEQTYPSVTPLDGDTVGVGMPVVVNFDVPVTDRAAFEKHMSVTTTPQQKGGWYWLSDNVAHWRPKTYWKAGTEVSVDVAVNSVPAGNGIYGQEDRHIEFAVGDAHVYKVDMDAHHMKVFSNGELLRTLPVTTGEEPKFTTRSGTKVIMEKFDSRRMNSETVGIPAGSPDAYDIDNVQWAMRVTNSGEFIHAAPWSVGSQGNANVSHGCTGMSTADADWLYRMTLVGDVVEYVGTDRSIEPGNGYSDWNVSWAEWQEGSAL